MTYLADGKLSSCGSSLVDLGLHVDLHALVACLDQVQLSAQLGPFLCMCMLHLQELVSQTSGS